MTKQSSPLQSLTFLANGIVGSYRAIGFNGAQATVQGQKVLGVSPRDVVPGKYSDVVVSGTTVVAAGGSLVVGDSLIADTFGRAIKATGAAGEFIFADALEVAGNGDFVEALLRR